MEWTSSWYPKIPNTRRKSSKRRHNLRRRARRMELAAASSFSEESAAFFHAHVEDGRYQLWPKFGQTICGQHQVWPTPTLAKTSSKFGQTKFGQTVNNFGQPSFCFQGRVGERVGWEADLVGAPQDGRARLRPIRPRPMGPFFDLGKKISQEICST